MKYRTLMLIIAAILLTAVIFLVNLHALIEGNNWIDAGIAILIIFPVVTLLHALLLFLLIAAAIKLPLGRMLIAWGVLIVLSFVPLFISYLNERAEQKQKMVENAAKERIEAGTATMADFELLYSYDEEIFVNALQHGYRQIAVELLAAVCDPSQRRLSNRILYLDYNGHQIAVQKMLGRWLVDAVENRLPEGVEMLLAEGGGGEHIDRRHRRFAVDSRRSNGTARYDSSFRRAGCGRKPGRRGIGKVAVDERSRT